MLVEGDLVRVRSGVRSGRLGRVVGFGIIGEALAPFVQYPSARSGVLREGLVTGDVEPYKLPERRDLEPLPMSMQKLTETLSGARPIYCGRMVSTARTGVHEVLTFVPRGRFPLRALVEKHGFSAAGVKALLEHGFVTRLPHLIEFDGRRLGATLEEGQDPEAVVETLLT